ncbi:hypothetical protein RhiirA5_431431 [Rhizophagus irregularis]|uniref:Uncharacterized protein n=1 Tax=Rhizophagus irregularis TaxID=588596 RepID=A0A2N0NV00_9GLOM|nr:hypothetical protein RhiirA5_431431 [Rhizophagus irregularis]
METEFSKLNCSYCNKPLTEELWCEKCDPLRIMEGWTSENSDIDKFIIKDTMYHVRIKRYHVDEFPEWVVTPLEIGEGGFANGNELKIHWII